MVKVVHFADAHIDTANYGRHDPQTGLPWRVIDFLKSLDQIVDTAIEESVDLVIFAGDAYKDRNPAPTFQREWGKRIMRLSNARIPTLLLVGNHDLSPALGRAHALEEFSTLEVPHVRVIDSPVFLKPGELHGLPVQILAIPWISRSGLMIHFDLQSIPMADVYKEIERRITDLVKSWIDSADPEYPTILTAHASVQGAKYGGERTVMLGNDLVLPGSLVRDPRLDYVALGHIHKSQDLNQDSHPPVIYPGSIERVDFGEALDDKFFVVANVSRGDTTVEWRQLEDIRPFVDCNINLQSAENITETILNVLEPADRLEDAIVRLVLEYPREWEALIDDAPVREFAANAFEFHLVKRPRMEGRSRLPEDQTLAGLTALDLLDKYWDNLQVGEEDREILQGMAKEIIAQDDSPN